MIHRVHRFKISINTKYFFSLKCWSKILISHSFCNRTSFVVILIHILKKLLFTLYFRHFNELCKGFTIIKNEFHFKALKFRWNHFYYRVFTYTFFFKSYNLNRFSKSQQIKLNLNKHCKNLFALHTSTIFLQTWLFVYCIKFLREQILNDFFNP